MRRKINRKRRCFVGRFCFCVKKYFKKKKKTGFTLIELLVALTIVGVLSSIGAITFNSSLTKSRDSRRKADLETIKTSLEDYYNDNGCYPDEDTFENCGSADFSPYLEKIPCDPITKDPYLYVPLSNQCSGYRIYTTLKNSNDPIIAKLSCDGSQGCGFGGDYNYGVSMGTAVSTTGFGGGTGGDTGGDPTYLYACDSGGVCNRFESDNPYLDSCPVTFEATDCESKCDNPAFRCDG